MNQTKEEWEELANIIIKCRNGSMDEKQFKATVSNAFQQAEQKVAREIFARIEDLSSTYRQAELSGIIEQVKHEYDI